MSLAMLQAHENPRWEQDVLFAFTGKVRDSSNSFWKISLLTPSFSLSTAAIMDVSGVE